jgi:hypothetical protein
MEMNSQKKVQDKSLIQNESFKRMHFILRNAFSIFIVLCYMFAPFLGFSQNLDSASIQRQIDELYANYGQLQSEGAADSLLIEIDTLEAFFANQGYEFSEQLAQVLFIKGMVNQFLGRYGDAETVFLYAKTHPSKTF